MFCLDLAHEIYYGLILLVIFDPLDEHEVEPCCFSNAENLKSRKETLKFDKIDSKVLSSMFQM